ncbi:MAG TPA: metal-dependent hydrolase [Pirellulaceae bacterium]|nr:metal-dependent hydrolase [Pirellulaceae bacterium]
MPTELTWLGHATWQLKTGEHTILVDPFLDDNPAAPAAAKNINATHILVSHGHFDHIADAAEIANRCAATVIANYEITTWLAKKHVVQNTVGMNLGGGVVVPFGRVKMTIAFHSSQLPDGEYGGNPCGFLLTLKEGTKIYFACDTALFGDMEFIGNGGLDVAVLPIGDLFTMGPDDAIEATRLLSPRIVIPSHYNTWPPIEQDAARWAERIKAETGARPVVLKPGETFEV